MKTKRKIVYYCDFCTKKSLRSLKIHEKHCTANPDRECRLCEHLSIRNIIDKYKKLFTVHPMNFAVRFKKKFTLNDIKNELEYNCPNCIFAIIRCLGLNRYYMKGKIEYFNYKKELEDWWELANEEAREDDERELYD